MTSFKNRLSKISKENGKVILANDYDISTNNITFKTIQNIKKLNSYLCAIKLNFHLLLPLGAKQITKITQTAHQFGLQTIADIKLNDIGNTNRVAVENLWNMGFDAVIVNPIMGIESLKNLVKISHRKERGVITLCHMSAPEAKISYDMEVNFGKKQKLYQLYLDWALTSKADGVIVGATFPEIIKYCKSKAKGHLNIISPGVGTQGGDSRKVIESGSDYIIVGRSILYSRDPKEIAKKFQLQTIS